MNLLTIKQRILIWVVTGIEVEIPDMMLDEEMRDLLIGNHQILIWTIEDQWQVKVEEEIEMRLQKIDMADPQVLQVVATLDMEIETHSDLHLEPEPLVPHQAPNFDNLQVVDLQVQVEQIDESGSKETQPAKT